MPVYEYFCSACNQDFELMRPVSKKEDPAFCPHCGQPGQKLVSAFACKTGFYLSVPEKGAFRKPSSQGEKS